MNILILRHGEALDDIENRYGGWADHELTENGKSQIIDRLVEINKLNIKFERIISSNLKRAIGIADILSNELKIPVEELEYAKEYNGYGVLSGMRKEDALLKYPDQIEKLKNKDEVDGMESLESFNRRLERVYKVLTDSNLENIILVSHGGFIRKFCEKYLGINVVKIEDCGFLLMEINNDNCRMKYSAGLETIENL